MANITDQNRELLKNYRDQGDGTYAPPVAALGYAWDSNISDWIKVTADHNTGGLNIVFAVPTLKTAPINLTSTGTVVTAVTSKRIKVFSILLNVSANMTVNWRDGGAGSAFEGPMAIAANGGYALGVTYPTFLMGTTAGNSLDLVISGSGTVAGRVSYWDTDAT